MAKKVTKKVAKKSTKKAAKPVEEKKINKPDDGFGSQYADEDWGQTRADTEANYEGTPSLKIKDGETVQVRFISKRKEAKAHWDAHPSKKRIICPKTDNPANPCLVCDLAAEDGNKDIKARWRCYIIVIDRADGKLKIWDFSLETKQKIHAIISNRSDINSTNPLSNYEIRISRKGEGLDTEYSLVVAKTATELSEEDEELIKGAPDLDELYKTNKLEELEELFSNTGNTDDSGFDEPAIDNTPVARGTISVDEDDDTLF